MQDFYDSAALVNSLTVELNNNKGFKSQNVCLQTWRHESGGGRSVSVESRSTLVVKAATKTKARLEFCLEAGVFERIELIQNFIRITKNIFWKRI